MNIKEKNRGSNWPPTNAEGRRTSSYLQYTIFLLKNQLRRKNGNFITNNINNIKGFRLSILVLVGGVCSLYNIRILNYNVGYICYCGRYKKRKVV